VFSSHKFFNVRYFGYLERGLHILHSVLGKTHNTITMWEFRCNSFVHWFKLHLVVQGCENEPRLQDQGCSLRTPHYISLERCYCFQIPLHFPKRNLLCFSLSPESVLFVLYQRKWNYVWEELELENGWFVGWYVKKPANCGSTEE